MVAAHVHTGVPGGVVVISTYLHTELDMEGENIAIIWAIVEYLHLLNRKGFDWILGGDFQMTWRELDKHGWMTTVNGFPMEPPVPTCIESLHGTKIDYMIVCSNLLSRVSGEMEVHMDTKLWPHRPASIQLQAVDRPVWARVLAEPRPIDRRTPIGCCRPPWMWQEVLPFLCWAGEEGSRKDLSVAWDAVLEGLEAELLDQRDLTGRRRQQYAGRGQGG